MGECAYILLTDEGTPVDCAFTEDSIIHRHNETCEQGHEPWGPCHPFTPPMTPPPDPVAALADALDTPAIFEDMLDDNEALDIATALHDALTAAGWSLSHDSEREALVAAIPEDPRCADHTLAGECHWCGAALDDGDSHDPTCRWVKARAAAEGRP